MNFRNASIKQKLILLIVLVSTIVMVLAAGAILFVEIVSFRQSLVDKSAALAQVLAVNSREGLALNRSSRVDRILLSLASEPHVRAAFVFRSGRPFAHYLNSESSFRDKETALPYSPCKLLDVASSTSEPRYHFSHNHLGYLLPIHLENRLVGQIYLQSDLGELNQRLSQFGVALFVLLIFSVLLAVYLATRLQNLVTEPLLALSGTMQKVSETGDFSLRIPPRNQDEIGVLVRRFNGMLEDLEERDGQLADYRHNLENLVEQRTSELSQSNLQLHQSNTDLAEARDRAEAANRAKSQFLANMSHEIRTPMIGVLGMTELLFNTGLNEKQQQLAQTVFNSGEALLEILNDLLDLSKIEAGKLTLVEEDFDLRESFDEVVGLFSEAAGRKGLSLRCELSAEIPWALRGDGGRLRQILLNLVGNAIKFTEQGGVILRGEVLEQDSGRVKLHFAIEDTGIGIENNAQLRIFDSFAQVDESMNRQFSGSGLGLAIVSQLVGLMGGDLGLKSTPGIGSCFWCDIPFVCRNELHAQPDLIHEDLRARKILLVDDDENSRQMLTEKLADRGFTVESAINGRQALSLLRQDAEEKPFSVAILESEMAGLGGRRLAEAIAGEPSLSGLKLVMMCAQEENILGNGKMSAAIVEWLYKPVRTSLLVSTLVQLLQREAVLPDVVKSSPSSPPALPPGWRILLVEDNPTTRDFVRRILAEGGQLLVSQCGEEALDLLEETPVDLVLMDCQMPGIDGYETTRQLREKGFTAPIIALTASAFPEDVAACLDAGMNAHICKPFRREELLRVLRSWLNDGAMERCAEDMR